MSHYHRYIGVRRLLLGLLLLLSQGAIAQEYTPYLKSSLTPMDTVALKALAESRAEHHACMVKSHEYQKLLKAANLQSYTEPTANMLDYDVRHYLINIALDFNYASVAGFVEVTLNSLQDGLNYVDLNLADLLPASSVLLDGTQSLTFNQSGGILTTYLPQTVDSGQSVMLRVNYSGPAGAAGYMNFYMFGSSTICYTSVEPFGSRYWWPCKDFPFDKPDSVDVIVTHPSQYTLVSNGLQRSRVDNGNGTATTHWHEMYPIATYLVTIGCTNYMRFDQSWEYSPGQFLPIQQYYYPDAPPDQWWSSAYFFTQYTIPSLEALSYWFTLYPYIQERYGHNQYGWGGAMEHQTMTSISPDFNAEYVIAHECAHQWGGDLITCANFHHIWMQEGFASYAECLYMKYHYGEDAYRIWLRYQKPLDAGTPYVEDLENEDVFDNATVYDKGSWLYYMLHMILGDDKFRQAMDAYFHDPKLRFGSGTTLDLQRVCESVYGAPMGWFFNAWVYQPMNPWYFYSYGFQPDTVKGGYKVSFYVDQQQPSGFFAMPIDIVAFAGTYDSAFTIFNDRRGQLFEFNLPNPPDSFWFDKQEKILCTVEYNPDFSVHIGGEIPPSGVLGRHYHFDFLGIGGVPPYHWSRSSGQVPYGTTFHGGETAYIDGVPNYAATFYFKVKIQDSSDPPREEERSYMIKIDPASPTCGDNNADGSVNIADATFLIVYIYLNGASPIPVWVGDANCDGKISLLDIVYLVNYIFRGGPAPCANCPK